MNINPEAETQLIEKKKQIAENLKGSIGTLSDSDANYAGNIAALTFFRRNDKSLDTAAVSSAWIIGLVGRMAEPSNYSKRVGVLVSYINSSLSNLERNNELQLPEDEREKSRLLDSYIAFVDSLLRQFESVFKLAKVDVETQIIYMDIITSLLNIGKKLNIKLGLNSTPSKFTIITERISSTNWTEVPLTVKLNKLGNDITVSTKKGLMGLKFTSTNRLADSLSALNSTLQSFRIVQPASTFVGHREPDETEIEISDTQVETNVRLFGELTDLINDAFGENFNNRLEYVTYTPINITNNISNLIHILTDNYPANFELDNLEDFEIKKTVSDLYYVSLSNVRFVYDAKHKLFKIYDFEGTIDFTVGYNHDTSLYSRISGLKFNTYEISFEKNGERNYRIIEFTGAKGEFYYPPNPPVKVDSEVITITYVEIRGLFSFSSIASPSIGNVGPADIGEGATFSEGDASTDGFDSSPRPGISPFATQEQQTEDHKIFNELIEGLDVSISIPEKIDVQFLNMLFNNIIENSDLLIESVNMFIYSKPRIEIKNDNGTIVISINDQFNGYDKATIFEFTRKRDKYEINRVSSNTALIKQELLDELGIESEDINSLSMDRSGSIYYSIRLGSFHQIGEKNYNQVTLTVRNSGDIDVRYIEQFLDPKPHVRKIRLSETLGTHGVIGNLEIPANDITQIKNFINSIPDLGALAFLKPLIRNIHELKDLYELIYDEVEKNKAGFRDNSEYQKLVEATEGVNFDLNINFSDTTGTRAKLEEIYKEIDKRVDIPPGYAKEVFLMRILPLFTPRQGEDSNDDDLAANLDALVRSQQVANPVEWLDNLLGLDFAKKVFSSTPNLTTFEFSDDIYSSFENESVKELENLMQWIDSRRGEFKLILKLEDPVDEPVIENYLSGEYNKNSDQFNRIASINKESGYLLSTTSVITDDILRDLAKKILGEFAKTSSWQQNNSDTQNYVKDYIGKLYFVALGKLKFKIQDTRDRKQEVPVIGSIDGAQVKEVRKKQSIAVFRNRINNHPDFPVGKRREALAEYEAAIEDGTENFQGEEIRNRIIDRYIGSHSVERVAVEPVSVSGGTNLGAEVMAAMTNLDVQRNVEEPRIDDQDTTNVLAVGANSGELAPVYSEQEQAEFLTLFISRLGKMGLASVPFTRAITDARQMIKERAKFEEILGKYGLNNEGDNNETEQPAQKMEIINDDDDTFAGLDLDASTNKIKGKIN